MSSLASPPEPTISVTVGTSIDISANLLRGYFREQEVERKQKVKAKSLTFIAVTAGAVWFTGLSHQLYSANSETRVLNQKVNAADSDLKSVKAGLRGASVPDEVLALPAQYQAKNERLVAQMAFILANTGPNLALQSLRFSEEKVGEPKFLGQAETTNILSVRTLLDATQRQRPELAGMITTVSQPQGTAQNVFNVSFEFKPTGGNR